MLIHFKIVLLGLYFIFSSCELYFNGNGFMSYDVHRFNFEQTYENVIRLSFRTIHPTSNLIVISGEKSEYLKLQVTEGKLSYTLQTGYIISVHTVGSYLNDNQWHSVHVIRHGRISKIVIDGTTKTLLSPIIFNTVELKGKIYIGGFGERQISDTRSVRRAYFLGCLSIKEIDSREPELYFKQKNVRVQVHPKNSVVLGCYSDGDELYGFQRTKSYVTIDFFPNQSLVVTSELHVLLSLRTFSVFGVVFSTPKSKCQSKLSLSNGNLVFEIKQNGKTVTSIRPKIRVNDGDWHVISFTITPESNFFEVDSNITKVALSENLPVDCMLPGTFVLGNNIIDSSNKLENTPNGFIGCISNTYFNHQKYDKAIQTAIESSSSSIYPIYLNSNATAKATHDVFREQNNFSLAISNVIVSGIDNTCQLSGKCFPNPCQHDGVCLQTWETYHCNCSSTNYYGNNCEVSIFKSICNDYYKLGLREESYCLLNSDSYEDTALATSLCKFDENGKPYTQISHDKKEEFDAAIGDERLLKYTFHKFKYSISLNSLKALIKGSSMCRQKLSFRCFNAPLMNAPNGSPNVQWVSREGESKGYWGGATKTKFGCECGMNSSCADVKRYCNCDALNQNKWLVDSGYINEKQYLPITRLDVTGIPVGAGFFNIGPLECFGSANEKHETVQHNGKPPRDILERVCVLKRNARLLFENLSERSIFRLTDPPIVTTTEELLSATAEVSLPKGKSYSFSKLEIILISTAAFAVVILLIKCVCCRILNKLYGQVVLDHDFSNPKYANVLPNTPRHSGNVKLKEQKLIDSYWV